MSEITVYASLSGTEEIEEICKELGYEVQFRKHADYAITQRGDAGRCTGYTYWDTITVPTSNDPAILLARLHSASDHRKRAGWSPFSIIQ